MPEGGLPQPAGYQPVGYGPVVIDIGQVAGRQAVVGSGVAGAVGLIAIVAGLTGQVDGGGEAGAVVIGVLFLLPVVLTIVFSKQVFRPRKLVFEPGGIRWDDPQGPRGRWPGTSSAPCRSPGTVRCRSPSGPRLRRAGTRRWPPRGVGRG